MNTWKQKGQYNTIEEAISASIGFPAAELKNCTMEDPRNTQNMLEATNALVNAINAYTPITVVGDYDSDGLNATAILQKIMNYYGAYPQTIIPKRMSEGYGLSKDIIDAIAPGTFVITVDNGIAAVDEIAQLREKNCFVVIMDHHLPGDTLPPANIIVDPHVSPENNKYIYYCGAGLALQMSLLLLEADISDAAARLRNELTAHAAIATITDVMPLTGCNRAIVMKGLHVLNDNLSDIGAGLRALRKTAGADDCTEETIGFKLGPIINAPARLYNAGGTSVLKELTCTDDQTADGYMSKMLEINEARKLLVQEKTVIVEDSIKNNYTLAQGSPLCVYCPEIPEGIIGIIAGKLAESYKMPAFVFSDTNENGILKASGRSGGTMDITPILDAVKPLTVKCGGHAGAAGLSIQKDNFKAVADAMHKAVKNLPQDEKDTVLYYDLELTPKDVEQALREVKSYAPYGEGVTKPVFVIRGFQPISKFGSTYRFIGQSKEHLKLNGAEFDAIGFGLAKQFIEMDCPIQLDLLCKLGENHYNGKTTIQVELIDFKPSEN